MGKDYFANHGVQGYVVFRNPNTTDSLYISGNEDIRKFAAPLRSLLKEYFGIHITEEEFEKHKDDRRFLNQNGTLKDYFIAIAKATKEIDNDFFVKSLDMYVDDNNRDTIVTDWRYEEEYKYLIYNSEVTTVRVHRLIDHNGNKISISPKEDLSEHSLDNHHVDYIVIPNDKYLDENINSMHELFTWSVYYIRIN